MCPLAPLRVRFASQNRPVCSAVCMVWRYRAQTEILILFLFYFAWVIAWVLLKSAYKKLWNPHKIKGFLIFRVYVHLVSSFPDWSSLMRPCPSSLQCHKDAGIHPSQISPILICTFANVLCYSLFIVHGRSSVIRRLMPLDVSFRILHFLQKRCRTCL